MSEVDISKLKRLITLICKEAEPHKDVLASSLGDVSLKMIFTDISLPLILQIDEEGLIKPEWSMDRSTDLEVAATKEVWDDIFASKVDYKQAYLTGKLRAKGNMVMLLKGSRSLGALIEVSKKVEAALTETEP